jgi:hypothetical protein
MMPETSQLSSKCGCETSYPPDPTRLAKLLQTPGNAGYLPLLLVLLTLSALLLLRPFSPAAADVPQAPLGMRPLLLLVLLLSALLLLRPFNPAAADVPQAPLGMQPLLLLSILG